MSESAPLEPPAAEPEASDTLPLAPAVLSADARLID
jgi:hypothetical protein